MKMFENCFTPCVVIILKITYFLVKPVLLALSSTAVCNETKDNHHQKVSTHEELLSLIPRTYRRRKRFGNETKGVHCM